MIISDLISLLTQLKQKHGDIDVVGSAPYYASEYEVDKENVTYVDPEDYPKHYSEYAKPYILIGPK